ncbi:hypothetical protein DO021_21575 [Desulfobacter hydrogenophilus]|uniref:Uncharacterized protein n=1 Tax=Desulfobacter hydrogenophilus TaxID=2291 RepID=A0A328F683_9BACT|nr:hypothetical protein DO021_21575 [Desulfobacter hydrogenophilus]
MDSAGKLKQVINSTHPEHRHGIYAIGPVSLSLLYHIRAVASCRHPLELTYQFTSHGQTHHRHAHIAPTTSRKWKAQGAAVEITQHIFHPRPYG